MKIIHYYSLSFICVLTRDVGAAAGSLRPVHGVERTAEVVVLVQFRLVDGAARQPGTDTNRGRSRLALIVFKVIKVTHRRSFLAE